MSKEIGKWAFIIGAVLAVIMGIGVGLGQAWGSNAWAVLVLVVLGLVVGFVNITAKEVQGFLIAAIAVLAANTANLAAANTIVAKLGDILSGIVVNVILVIAPAALIVALRAVYGFAAE